MSRRELAEYYISKVSEEYPALVRQPQGFLTLALIRACGDLQREKDVLEKVLREFIETDAGRALSVYRKAVIEGSPAPMPEDATGEPEPSKQGDAPDDQPPSMRATAPEASGMAMSDEAHRDPTPEGVPFTELPGTWDHSDFLGEGEWAHEFNAHEHKWPSELRPWSTCEVCGLRYEDWAESNI